MVNLKRPFVRNVKDKTKINMKWLTLTRIKAQCRIEQDFTEEDDLLEMYGESAEEVLLNYLNRSYEDVMEVYGRVPAPLVHASLMLVASSYKDREKDLTQEVHSNPTFSLLLKPLLLCCFLSIRKYPSRSAAERFLSILSP